MQPVVSLIRRSAIHTLISKVAGVTFEGRQAKIARMRGDEPVRIVPEPDNPYDSNALAVHVAMHDGQVEHVGFIPRDLAKIVAPLLEGEQIMVTLKAITGGYDGLNYGLLLEFEVPDNGAEPSQKAIV